MRAAHGQPEPPRRRVRPEFYTVPLAASILLIGLAALSLIGHTLEIDRLVRVVRAWPRIMPSTVAGFLVSGASLWLLAPEPGSPGRKLLGRMLALPIALMGLLTLVVHFVDHGGGITPYLLLEGMGAGRSELTRRASSAAFGFLFGGTALLLLDTGARGLWTAQWLALITALIAWFALTGTILGGGELHVRLNFAPISVYAALGFIALAVGILFARAERGLMAVVTGPDLGGMLARRLLPAAVLIPFFIGWLRYAGERAGLYDTAFGINLHLSSTIVLLAAIIWWSARGIGHLDAERKRVTDERTALLATEQELRAAAERRAREEAALRKAAEAVTSASTIGEVVARIAQSALTATDAYGAVVVRVRTGAPEYEIMATAGNVPTQSGGRAAYQRSLVQHVLETGEIAIVDDLSSTHWPIPEELRRRCPHCSVLVLPLTDAGEAYGALKLLRRAGEQGFGPDLIARATVFANLAALAFGKIHLLQDSENKRRELERVMESRARLIRGFSHDVKNPLSAADGRAQLLEQGIGGELAPEHRVTVAKLRRSLQRAVDLIEDLVALARAEAGQLELHMVPVDLREVAREIAEEYRPQAQAKGLALEVDLAGQLPVLDSDTSRVRQILGNLISNAIKFTDSGQVGVRVEARDTGPSGPGPWLVAEVHDTGRGIPADKQQMIFDEFTRVDPEHRKGAGIGLAISRRLAEALGGRLTVRSEPSRGSTLTLRLARRRPEQTGHARTA